MTEPQPISGLFKALIERAITSCDDPNERKERVLIARDTGVFSEADAAAWLARLDARTA